MVDVDPKRQRHDTDPPPGEVTPDPERRPIGALAVAGFLMVTILALWFGMYALNMARS